MTLREELGSMLSQGPVADVFRADEALELHAAVGEHADAVNASTFAPTFVALQGYALEQFTLAVARLLERPNPRYPLRSLPAVVEFVAKHAADLAIGQPYWVQQGLTRLGAWQPAWQSMTDSDLTKEAAAALRSLLPTPESSDSLNSLKAARDKRLAHPEHIEAELIPKTTWGAAALLLDTPRQVIGVLGAYTNTAYVDDNGSYFLSSDAQRAALATKRLLRHLGIAKE